MAVRTRITSSCYRIPDLAVWLGSEIECDQYGVPLSPPLLAVEILAPEDVTSCIGLKVREYLSIGVQWIWLIDPVKGTALYYSQTDPDGSPCEMLHTENPTIDIALETVLQLQA
jgi:Uma2 family endonuclease